MPGALSTLHAAARTFCTDSTDDRLSRKPFTIKNVASSSGRAHAAGRVGGGGGGGESHGFTAADALPPPNPSTRPTHPSHLPHT
jgi:hypothetical protein